MKLLLVFSAIFALAVAQSLLMREGGGDGDDDCQQDATPIFREQVLLPFNTRIASLASLYTGGHFIISAHSIWLSLASVAESGDYSYNEESNGLWNSLYYPTPKCVRDQIYNIALGLDGSSIEFLRNRALAIDNNVNINEEWIAFSHNSGILPYLPVDYEDEAFGRVQEFMGIEEKVPLSGHSVFLDRLDWGSLWTSAFADETVTEGPFYNELGLQIATVEYLRMKARVSVTDIPSTDIRVLALPVGVDERYTMLFAVGGEATTMIEAVFSRDILSDLELTEEPVDVAIPKVQMSSGLDLRWALSNMDLDSIFTDERITSHISEPSASPMGYLQRVNININGSMGIREESNELLEILEDLADSFTYLLRFDNGSPDHYHFIANRPFLFSLYETRIGVPVFTGVYSYPGQRGQKYFDGTGVNLDVLEIDSNEAVPSLIES